MRIEVKIEQLIIDAFPTIKVEKTLIGQDGVPVEIWSGTLADLVSDILKETTPAYSPYQEE